MISTGVRAVFKPLISGVLLLALARLVRFILLAYLRSVGEGMSATAGTILTAIAVLATIASVLAVVLIAFGLFRGFAWLLKLLSTPRRAEPPPSPPAV